MAVNTSEPHRRYNPLTQEWILVSPHRTQRPWQGAQEAISRETRPQYDPKCYLCPGNTRMNGEVNDKYEETFVFPNDFAAVKPAEAVETGEVEQEDDLFKAETVTGTCKVICFSPRHDQTLAQLSHSGLLTVIEAWKSVLKGAQDQGQDKIAYCQIFENKGAAMGCSNPHPHGQAWLTSVVPDEPAKETVSLEEYKQKHGGRGLLEDYVQRELKASQDPDQNRIVAQTETFIAVVPYWATWPFETLVLPVRRAHNIGSLTKQEEADLATVLKELTIRYDNLFKTSFPYSMGLHQSVSVEDDGTSHLHLHFYPPLLRSATVKKFLVGFELLGMAQRDLTPEKAAQSLRAVDGKVHYLETLE